MFNVQVKKREKLKSLKGKTLHRGSTLFSFVSLAGGPRVIFKPQTIEQRISNVEGV